MKLNFFLMHFDEKVAYIQTQLTLTQLEIKSFDVINEPLLPVMLKNMPNKARIFENWWKSRIIPYGRREFYNFIRVIYGIPFNTRPLLTAAMYPISLFSYAASLSDKYWINPEKEEVIPFFKLTNGCLKDLTWVPKTFSEIDFFKNPRTKEYDRLFIDSSQVALQSDSFYSPSFCTNGNIQKYWDFVDNSFYLMKYMYNINELNFNEVIINDFLTNNYKDLSNKVYSFTKTTNNFENVFENEKKYHLIASKCFTDENTEFVPASEIVFAAGGLGDDIYDLYYMGCDILGIKDAEYPLIVSNEIDNRFGIEEDRSLDNFGFIRDAKTRVFLRPAPLFGNSYYKYILEGYKK